MRVIYVDDEKPALDNFRLTVANFLEIDSLELFQDGEKALAWAENHLVDVAFLDMEMPGLHGLGLALRIREIIPSVRIVFVTAYNQYALDAWNIDAMGYVLKPYTVSDIRKELGKCIFRPLPSQRILIQTIPTFSVSVDGVPLRIPGAKLREMLALLVERGERGITTGEGIAFLWPDRPNDSNTQSLFRMTYKRLVNVLEEAGAGHILVSKDNRRFLRADQVDCDLYRILSGDQNAAKKYAGQYMQEYDWAEDRNGQLHRMLLSQPLF
jgi:two-component SAPR family response regulator